MILRAQADHGQLKSRLAKTRQMLSLIDKDIVAASDDMYRISENWVPMWVDRGHCVVSDCGMLTAHRGLSFKGRLMWLVRHPAKKHGYHAQTECPFDAFTEAQSAWRRRAEVRAEWPEVLRISRELFTGKLRFDVTRDDAYASPLCRAGIDGFMDTIGMSNVYSISGRTAAVLMRVDSQIGFVIREAHRRHMRNMRAKMPHAVQSTQGLPAS